MSVTELRTNVRDNGLALSLGALLLALVWIYYAALIVFIGALITAVVDERARNHAGRGTASRRGRG
jgi:membrane protein